MLYLQVSISNLRDIFYGRPVKIKTARFSLKIISEFVSVFYAVRIPETRVCLPGTRVEWLELRLAEDIPELLLTCSACI